MTEQGLLFTGTEIERTTIYFRDLMKNRLNKIADDKSQKKSKRADKKFVNQETFHPKTTQKTEVYAN